MPIHEKHFLFVNTISYCWSQPYRTPDMRKDRFGLPICKMVSIICCAFEKSSGLCDLENDLKVDPVSLSF